MQLCKWLQWVFCTSCLVDVIPVLNYANHKIILLPESKTNYYVFLLSYFIIFPIFHNPSHSLSQTYSLSKSWLVMVKEIYVLYCKLSILVTSWNKISRHITNFDLLQNLLWNKNKINTYCQHYMFHAFELEVWALSLRWSIATSIYE